MIWKPCQLQAISDQTKDELGNPIGGDLADGEGYILPVHTLDG